MNRYFLITIFTITFLIGHNEMSLAVCTEGPANTFTCNTDPPNPDPDGIQQETNDNNLTINVLPGGAIDNRDQPGNPDGIETGNGNNVITVDNGSVTGSNVGIRTGSGDDTANITDSTVAGTDNEGIILGTGTNLLNVIDSVVTSIEDRAISLSIGVDEVHVQGSEVKVLTASGADSGLATSSGDDKVFVENSIIQGGTSNVSITPTAIELASGNDTLTLLNGADLRGLSSGNVEGIGIINCGIDFDTIIFAMDVPEERLSFFSNQIAQATVPDGNVTINGLYYEWVDCEVLVNELVGVRNVRPIPTLSEWGLIVMAGIIGLAGFIAIRKKYAAA